MLTKIHSLLLWASLLFFLSPPLAFSQCWPRSEKLLPEKAFNNQEGFGRAIDHENNIAVIGAPQSDSARTSSGLVYVFAFDGASWNKIASLAPSDHRMHQNFGQSVKINGDYIFVGDPWREEAGKAKGAIYIFKKPAEGWRDMVESSLLTSSDPRSAFLGTSLDVFGNTLIAGAPYSLDNNDTPVGAAYIFQLQSDTWTQIARLSTTHPRMSTFGSNVDLERNMAVVVAAEETQTTHTGVGSVYVFEKDPTVEWADAVPVARLTRDAPAGAIWYLGLGLAVDEKRNTVFVTDQYYEGDAGSHSEVRVYKKPATGWTEKTEDLIHIIEPSDLTLSHAMAFEEPYLYYLSGTSVAITRPDASDEWTALTPVALLANIDSHPMQRFGTAISAWGDNVLVSASGQVTLDREHAVIPVTPAVYEFIKPASGWTEGTHPEVRSFTHMPKTTTDFAFGRAIDIDGDFAIVGSPNDNHEGRSAGVVYVYQLVDMEWRKIAKLSPSDGEPNNFFGGSVAISQNFIAVSAVNRHHRDDTGKIIDFSLGAVYIFEKPASGWRDMHETYKIIKSEGQLDGTNDDRDDDNFGVTIDMDHPYLIVSKYDRGSRPNMGSVYVYRLNVGGAVLEATLNPSTRSAVNDFGHALKIQGGTIIIGGGPMRFWFIEANAVFVYNKTGDLWKDTVESAILSPSDITYGGAFGYSIDTNKDASKIIIGAPAWFGEQFSYDAENYFKGAAYIYEKPAGGWRGLIKEKVRLTLPDQPAYGCMGASVHIEDRYAVVGSPQNYFTTYGGNNQGPGRVYFYQMPDEGWRYKLPDKIIRGDEAGNAESDYFGTAVDGVFGFLMIGAIADDNQNSIDAGSVYVYTEYPFIYPGQSPICENDPPVQLNAFPQGGVWSGAFEDPALGLFDPALATEGINRIKYRVDDCDASNTLLIDVKKVLAPFALAPKDSLFFCGSDEVRLNAPAEIDVSYRWAYSQSGSDFQPLNNSVLPELSAVAEGFYKAVLSNFCSTETASIWVGDLRPDAGQNFTACISAANTPLTGNYWNGSWTGNGVTGRSMFDPSLAGIGSHALIFAVSPVEGCLYRDTVEVQVKGIPSLAIDPANEETFCYTGAATLTATDYSNVTYDWYFGEDEQNAAALDGESNIIIANQPGLYKVVAFDGDCSRDAQYRLVLPAFKPTITPEFDSLAFCQDSPPEIIAESIPGANYTWLTLDGEESVAEGQSVGSFATKLSKSGRYRLHIASHGCEYQSPEMVATKIPADSVFVPNIITPNGDSKNDVFEIYTSSTEPYLMRIYDRYGSQVYSTTNDGQPWRGSDSAGVYFWVLNYFAPCEHRYKTYKGTLHVMK